MNPPYDKLQLIERNTSQRYHAETTSLTRTPRSDTDAATPITLLARSPGKQRANVCLTAACPACTLVPDLRQYQIHSQSRRTRTLPFHRPSTIGTLLLQEHAFDLNPGISHHRSVAYILRGSAHCGDSGPDSQTRGRELRSHLIQPLLARLPLLRIGAQSGLQHRRQSRQIHSVGNLAHNLSRRPADTHWASHAPRAPLPDTSLHSTNTIRQSTNARPTPAAKIPPLRLNPSPAAPVNP